MKLRDFLEKNIFPMEYRAKVKQEQKIVRKYCKHFKKGIDGFCINYAGCKRVPESCGRYCNEYKNIKGY
ncbi:hypothetical protein K144316041_23530 [Clostridium tetani]|uniref:hypothetical protein n=1 Tax=Clostridium tetani TaxID=1513 RepID=UPI002952C989|nr:hypothetical protein [Clostridium tetani]BDR73645.1 hypothetical protein K144316041_23530 [Clostridium tetani]